MPERLDRALVARGLARRRAEAAAWIAAGSVRVDGRPADKPSQSVPEDAVVTVQEDAARCPYVSRGGLKLEAALAAFSIPVSGRLALDLGASTGGFTDCLLQQGAASVVAVDVGHGQMVPALAADPRVDGREGVNVRHLTPSDFPSPFPLIVGDLSFISLRLIVPVLPPLLAPGGDVLLLVKPQFEVGRGRLDKHGVVRNAAYQEEAVEAVQDAARACGLRPCGLIPSPILGGEGNREFLLHLRQENGVSGAKDPA